MAVKVDKEGRGKLGIYLKGKLDQYIQDRSELEQQWLRNLRQYRGVYDPEVLALIPKEKSRAYPRDTRVKVKGFVAKMMEMMFPATDMNWELFTSPIPSIAQQDLQQIINVLTMQEQIAATQEQRQPKPLMSETIEAAVKVFANERRQKMQQQILDQLMDPDVDWPQLAKRVVRSGAIYGFGVVMAPLVRKQKEREWRPDPATGQYVAVEVVEHRPYPEFVKVWDLYPDLSAMSWEEQEGGFQRMVLSRNSLSRLTERPGFDAKAIKTYLKDHPTGNYSVKAYESSLNELNKGDKSMTRKDERRYEIFRWFGFLSGHALREAGVDVPDEKLGDDVLADVWMIDDLVIYADMAPFGERFSDVYHAYVYAEDESAGLTGIGMPEEVRDRQMSICAATRALYDNMAATAGPVYEVAVDLLKRGQDYKTIHSFKVLEREGEGADLAYPAVRAVNTDSHVPEIQAILQDERQQFDIESNLPSWTMGNAQPLGEAFRTSANMSQMSGGANMVTKDHVRSFDRFTTSVINAFLRWNMEFGPEDVKGDFQTRAKGNISLVAKEVRGAALDQFMVTLVPQERAMLKTREILIERLKSRDLPTDIVVSADEAVQIQEQMAQAQAQAAQTEGQLTQAKTDKLTAEAERIRSTINAQVAEIMSRIDAMKTDAKVKRDRVQLDTLNQMLEQVLASTQEKGTPYVQ